MVKILTEFLVDMATSSTRIELPGFGEPIEKRAYFRREVKRFPNALLDGYE